MLLGGHDLQIVCAAERQHDGSNGSFAHDTLAAPRPRRYRPAPTAATSARALLRLQNELGEERKMIGAHGRPYPAGNRSEVDGRPDVVDPY